MKKYVTLELLIDETVEDAKECAEEIIADALGHHYCCDGTVNINVIQKSKE